jgi:hypothetical protein
MKRAIAQRLRRWADRVDHESGPRAFGAYWNFVPGVGLVITQTDGVQVQPPVRGVPLWFMQQDYDRGWVPA